MNLVSSLLSFLLTHNRQTFSDKHLGTVSLIFEKKQSIQHCVIIKYVPSLLVDVFNPFVSLLFNFIDYHFNGLTNTRTALPTSACCTFKLRLGFDKHVIILT